MLALEIPGFKELVIDHLVLDYNGTLAVDGKRLAGVQAHLNRLADHLSIHVVTADTFGQAAEGLKGIDCRLTVLPPGRQDRAKLDFVNQLGAAQTVAIGNGRNDALMLAAATLGIAVILEEGASTVSVNAADVVCTSITAGLELLLNPLRLAATLRC